VNLIEQLLVDGADDNVSITSILRKARFAASRLELLDLQSFLDNEENGYTDNSLLPKYRLLPGQLEILLTGYGWRYETSQLPLPCPNPIGQVLAMAGGADKFVCLSALYPPEVAERHGFREIPRARFNTSRATLVGILEGVRSRVFNWAIELDKAGVRGEGIDFSREDKAKALSITVNQFHGPVGGVSQGESAIGSIEQWDKTT